jgi:hypothetical protein
MVFIVLNYNWRENIFWNKYKVFVNKLKNKFYYVVVVSRVVEGKASVAMEKCGDDKT